MSDLGVHEPRRKFTADEVLRMVETGILGEDDRVELIEGELLEMSPQDPIHASLVERLNGRLVAAYAGTARVRVQLPLLASPTSLPEPDFAVVRGDERAFERRHPTGADTLLVVEVSWTTVARDRRKAELYARAQVPVYWRIDVAARRVEVHEHPTPDGAYTLVRLLDEDERLRLPETEAEWIVSDVLPLPSAP